MSGAPNVSLLKEAEAALRQRWPQAKPRLGLVLGSGWSQLKTIFEIMDGVQYYELSGLQQPGVAGHSGMLYRAECSGVETFIFDGRRHFYESGSWSGVALAPFILKSFGAEVLFLTSAVGSLRKDFAPGDLLLVEDHINFTGTSPLVSLTEELLEDRFLNTACLYDKGLKATLAEILSRNNIRFHSGILAMVTGPAFETPAEARMLSRLGADCSGMSLVPEALFGRSLNLRVLGLSCISNFAAGIGDSAELAHERVLEMVSASVAELPPAIAEFWRSFSGKV